MVKKINRREFVKYVSIGIAGGSMFLKSGNSLAGRMGGGGMGGGGMG
jgi:hypothetical protein